MRLAGSGLSGPLPAPFFPFNTYLPILSDRAALNSSAGIPPDKT